MKKKFILFFIVVLLLTPKLTFAAEQCNYTNYYYFAEINSKSDFQGNIPETGSYSRTHTTYYPALPEGATKVSKNKVCLSRTINGTTVSDTSHNCINEDLNLETFYTNFEKVIDQGTKYDLSSTPLGKSFYMVYNTEPTVAHYMHGAWEETNATNPNDGKGYVNFTIGANNEKIPANDIAKGSFLPDTEIDFNTDTGKVTITRNITREQFNQATAYESKWTSDTVMAPALYKVVYSADCPPEKTYNARIDYFYKGTEEKVEFKDKSKDNPYTKDNLPAGYGVDQKVTITSPEAANESCKPLDPTVDIVISRDNPESFHKVVEYECTSFEANIRYFIVDDDGNKTEVKKFDDGSETPYHKKGLPDGYEETKKSPEMKGCSVNKPEVNIKIEGQNFNTEVIYSCSKVKSSADTGNILIYLTWLLGFTSLGCSIYYFRKDKQESKVNK